MSRNRDVDLHLARWRRNGAPMPVSSLGMMPDDDRIVAEPRGGRNSGEFAAGLYSDGTAAVTCWCERSVVRVPLGDVAEGRTRCCGSLRCESAAVRAGAVVETGERR